MRPLPGLLWRDPVALGESGVEGVGILGLKTPLNTLSPGIFPEALFGGL